MNGLWGQEVFDFLIDLNDLSYQAWWPGTHLELHSIKVTPNYVGSVVFMDEFIGKRRVKTKGVVREATPGERIVWQVQKLIMLPVTLSLELQDDKTGTNVTHTIRVGYDGVGRVIDPIFRLYFSPKFAWAMDEHVKTEFPRLRDMLQTTAV